MADRHLEEIIESLREMNKHLSSISNFFSKRQEDVERYKRIREYHESLVMFSGNPLTSGSKDRHDDNSSLS